VNRHSKHADHPVGSAPLDCPIGQFTKRKPQDLRDVRIRRRMVHADARNRGCVLFDAVVPIRVPRACHADPKPQIR